MRILTGVDTSETALEAARKAAEIAVAFGAELKVVSAYGKFEREKISLGSEDYEFSTEQDALTISRRVVDLLVQEFPGVKADAVASVGKPAEVLTELAGQIEADLIVVGNKRVQGITRVLGSIARDITTQAPCDVYVVNTHGAK